MSKSKLIEYMKKTNNPHPEALRFFHLTHNELFLRHTGTRNSNVEFQVYKPVFVSGYSRYNKVQGGIRASRKTSDLFVLIRETDIGPEEFYNMLMLFLPHKNTNIVGVWMTYYSILKGSTDPKIEESILCIADPLVKAEFALKYAYHTLNGNRFERYGSYINEWIISSWTPAKVNPYHFIYVYECLVDPCNKGSAAYENFLLNNANQSLFHIVPYVGRTNRLNEKFDQVLYNAYLVGNSGYYVDYIKLVHTMGINIIERMKETIGEDVSHMIGITQADTYA